ncbi:MAG: DMT family transporter [Deltaproteobacteria bacterium]|jgi:drug/metabolite transporter (DMT)-like permease|nr:DMT family transporter [Deltaproteobacteria bacterium]
MKPRTSAVLLLVLASTLWSTSGVLIKSIQWSPLALAGARGLIAAITISLLLPGGFKPRELTRGHVLAACFLAVLSLLFVQAMKMAPAANVIVLQYTAPLWVAFLAPLILRERTSGRDWAFMGLIFGGVVLFFVDGLSMSGFWGNVLALASGLLFGAQAIALGKIKKRSPAQAIILGNLLTFFLGLPAWGGPWPDLGGGLMILVLGVGQMGLAYYCFSLAVPRVSSLELVLIPMLEPIICPIWVFLVLHEVPGRWAVAGALVVIVSVTSWSLLKARDAATLMRN